MPETPVQDATSGVTATGRATGLVPPDAPPAYHRLLERLGQVSDLHAATTLLNWDEEVNMPPGGAAARAEQKATLNRLAHEAFTAPEVGQWLDELAGWEAQLDPESDAAALLRVTRRDYERARRVPPDLVAELARASSQGYQAWVEARSQQRFAVFAPALARLLELRRQMADALGYPEERYDALLEGHEPGMRTRQVRELFTRLKEGLVPLVQAIAERQDRVRDDFLHGDYPDAAQWELTLEALEAIGFDFQRGRQDRSIHPFTAPLATGDVRLTTRINPRVFGPAFFSSLHEGGHGLYEQGFPAAWHRTPLADGASSAVHESQSRLWENVIGRSREFWRFFFPRVQARFPQQLAGVDAEAMYRAVNRSRPSLIRVDADEVTYNLHIMLRFELELALLSGDLPVDDLPGAWREKTRAYLGIEPAHDVEGVLQDIHWSWGGFGYFPSYALGNLIALQLWEAALRDEPGLPEEIARGRLGGVLQWMRQHVHRHGARYEPLELVRRVTGAELSEQPFLRYIRRKYGELYGL
ncbi:carboxypeptidase M32 [Thermaerobacter sp. PB12/4term]|uniref:carboxypeptidase M32 n=1 Tax=Thermaerobacter sp. PB12/4term TaxID=2293838 RepID=UPI00194003EF|nr:carboxypeptidase M32 [Thermaerobacter sp. PB12/4term]